MFARGGQTQGVASASSNVAGASNARAENSDDARELPAAAREVLGRGILLDGCCRRIRPFPWNPSDDPPPPLSEAFQAVESPDRRVAKRSRPPRARRSRPSERWSNAFYAAKLEFAKEFSEATAGIRGGVYFSRGRLLRRAEQITEKWKENKESKESDSG